MNTSFDVLVIILSSFLAIFIGLAIACTILIMKLVQSVRSIVAKGEQLVDSAEEFGDTLMRNSAAVSIVKALVSAFGNKGKRK